ncbi:hemerythrin-like domain-containing protein [Methanococcus maripaludis]|uniref:Hemerythrin-like domain-containing protein n=1 Tax=Methanococcus maripaludis TaxID=39152 RepID=A0A7J9NMC5_METMI|nr:hypothetical protein [Methanococcus maripaludis]MBA2846605.1 hemerythrin-like domain-containing protein [Methanococcus maripaludis]
MGLLELLENKYTNWLFMMIFGIWTVLLLFVMNQIENYPFHLTLSIAMFTFFYGEFKSHLNCEDSEVFQKNISEKLDELSKASKNIEKDSKNNEILNEKLDKIIEFIESKK